MLDLLKLMSQLAICWAAAAAQGTSGREGRRCKQKLRGQFPALTRRRGNTKLGRDKEIHCQLPLPSLSAIKDKLSHHSVFFPLSHTSCILFMAFIFQLYGSLYGGCIYGIWLTALNRVGGSNKSQLYIYFTDLYTSWSWRWNFNLR